MKSDFAHDEEMKNIFIILCSYLFMYALNYLIKVNIRQKIV